MGYVADLTQAGYLISVGYLDRAHPFTRGLTSPSVVERLVGLAKEPMVYWCGYHTCDLDECGMRSEGRHPAFCYQGCTIPVGSTDIYVPGAGVVYVAPSLILHYIEAHQYLPPQSFLNAVDQCPDPRSQEYVAALRKVAPDHPIWRERVSGGETSNVAKPRKLMGFLTIFSGPVFPKE